MKPDPGGEVPTHLQASTQSNPFQGRPAHFQFSVSLQHTGTHLHWSQKLPKGRRSLTPTLPTPGKADTPRTKIFLDTLRPHVPSPQGLSLPIKSCVALSRSLNLSGAQLPLLQIGHDNSSCSAYLRRTKACRVVL